jgi:hypothetical protein
VEAVVAFSAQANEVASVVLPSGPANYVVEVKAKPVIASPTDGAARPEQRKAVEERGIGC